jgi:ATP synthase F1 complex assembly factor 1
MILSQFQPPNHFLLAFLEDYKMDPSRAQPLLTLSIFDDLVDSHDLALVRCDIINAGIEEDEGYKLAKCLIGDYLDEEKFGMVHLFNKMPEKFDVEEFVRGREEGWKNSGGEGKVEDV